MADNIRLLLKENKRILIFCGRVVLLLVFFSVLNSLLFESSGLHQLLIDFLGTSAIKILALFGYQYGYDDSLIYLNDEAILEIGTTCDGLSFMILFLSFVLAYPTNNIPGKIIFSVIGIITIHVLNTIRTFLLVLNFTYNTETFEFNHKYTFVLVVYGIILWMWVIWAKKNASKT